MATCTAGLARDAKARKAATVEETAPEPEPIEAKAPRPGRKAPEPIADNAEGATT
jgi:hypothetical protein